VRGSGAQTLGPSRPTNEWWERSVELVATASILFVALHAFLDFGPVSEGDAPSVFFAYFLRWVLLVDLMLVPIALVMVLIHRLLPLVQRAIDEGSDTKRWICCRVGALDSDRDLARQQRRNSGLAREGDVVGAFYFAIWKSMRGRPLISRETVCCSG
jgi:hypothetical protein